LEAGGIIGSLYNTEKVSKIENDDDEKIRHYIDALVNISTGGHDSAHISRRIIYFKDFGSITLIAQLLLGYILRALLKLKKRGSSSTEDYSPAISTILVFGISSGIKLISGKDDESDPDDLNSKFRSQWHDALRAGGQTLRRILPEASYRFSKMREKEPSCSRLCPLSAQFPSKSLQLIRSSHLLPLQLP
jgi:hypothetical protein